MSGSYSWTTCELLRLSGLFANAVTILGAFPVHGTWGRREENRNGQRTRERKKKNMACLDKTVEKSRNLSYSLAITCSKMVRGRKKKSNIRVTEVLQHGTGTPELWNAEPPQCHRTVRSKVQGCGVGGEKCRYSLAWLLRCHNPLSSCSTFALPLLSACFISVRVTNVAAVLSGYSLRDMWQISHLPHCESSIWY